MSFENLPHTMINVLRLTVFLSYVIGLFRLPTSFFINYHHDGGPHAELYTVNQSINQKGLT